MFTNRYRTQNIIVLSFVITLFCIYSNKARPEIALTYGECLLNPEKYDGQELIVKNGAITGEIFKGKFNILQYDTDIMVIGNTEGLKSNEYISLRATFHKEGYLTVKELHVHTHRRLKIVISILPVVLVGWLFFKKYKLNYRKMVLMER
jgi:hypothetical protein